MKTQTTIYDQLPDDSRKKLHYHGIRNQEMLDAWAALIPLDVLKNQFFIPEPFAETLKSQAAKFQQSQGERKLPGGYNFSSKPTFGKKQPSSTENTVNLDDYPHNEDLSPKVPGVKDQGNYGSCVAFAFTSMLESVLNYDRELSPRFCYLTTKWCEGNESEGTRLEFARTALKRFGICEENVWPYCTQNMLHPPPYDVLDEAQKIQLVSYKEHVNGCVLKFILDAISGLSTGKPQSVAVGLLIYASSWNPEIIRKHGLVLLPLDHETAQSGHAVLIVGFVIDSSFAGGGYCLVLNSHGLSSALESDYCEPGFLAISFEYIRTQCMEALAVTELDVSAVPAAPDVNLWHPSIQKDTTAPIFARIKEDTTKKHQIRAGTTGSGKTTHTKIHLLKESNSHKFILDIQGDYASDHKFTEASEAVTWDLLEDGFPHNILLPNRNSEMSDDNVHKLHVDWLLSSFKACIPTLGSRQRALLKEQLDKLVYTARTLTGIPTHISEMVADLKRISAQQGPKSRLAGSLLDQVELILDLGILDKRSDLNLSDIIRSNKTIIFKCVIPNGSAHILKLVSIFLVDGIFSLYKMSSIGVTHPGILVLDEFHRLPKVQLWEDIAREGRKYNLALWAASQVIDDMDELLANVGNRYIFKVANGEQARKISKKLAWNKKHQAIIESEISRLKAYECIDPVIDCED